MRKEEISERFSDKILFGAFKETWKELKFSFIHFAMNSEENIEEFYQTLYGSVLTSSQGYSLFP